jgi:hypothetical protein
MAILKVQNCVLLVIHKDIFLPRRECPAVTVIGSAKGKEGLACTITQ